jgi:hypothetical protein
MQSGKSLLTFQRNALPPPSGSKSNIDKKAVSMMFGTCFAYSSTLKKKVIYSFKILINIYHTTWCNILKDSSLHCHHHENLKSHRNFFSVMYTDWFIIFWKLTMFYKSRYDGSSSIRTMVADGMKLPSNIHILEYL